MKKMAREESSTADYRQSNCDDGCFFFELCDRHFLSKVLQCAPCSAVYVARVFDVIVS